MQSLGRYSTFAANAIKTRNLIMAYRTIKFGIKSGLVGGAVYYTVDQGLWSDSEHTTQLYGKVYKTVAPYVKEVPVEIPEIPKLEDVTSLTQQYWNKGVITSCYFIGELPDKMVEWSKMGFNMANKQLQIDQLWKSEGNDTTKKSSA